MDRRIRRTRRMLGEAFVGLIKDKDYDSITIQEITDRADVHRATFYLHFATKEDLLVASLETLFGDLGTRTKAESGVEQPSFLKESAATRVMFEHVAEYADLYRVLVGQKGVGYVTYHIINYMTEIFDEKLQNDIPNSDELPIPRILIARHLSGSIYSLLTWWLEHDMPYDTDTMSSYTNDLCRQGVRQIIGAQENAS